MLLKLSFLLFFLPEKPTFITELKRETLSDYGSTVTLPCDAVGVPPPTLTWFRNAEPINHLLGTRYALANVCFYIYTKESEIEKISYD
jgi:hypothetical protein